MHCFTTGHFGRDLFGMSSIDLKESISIDFVVLIKHVAAAHGGRDILELYLAHYPFVHSFF